jgi:dienelactone hydrolase
MTNIASISSSPMNGGAAISRTTVRIPATSGDELEAWLYLPEGDGPHPVVVMAHGIGAIKAGGLAPFAERFCREGFAAIVFDYRQFGGSTGQPREELSFPRQLEDYSTVIGWAAMHPDIDAHRIFAWGTSFAVCISLSLPPRIPDSPVRLGRFHSLTGSLRQGWPRPFAGFGFWQQRC